MSQIRNTKQKQIILNYLKEHNNEHITIEQINKELEGNASITTIYRMINQLMQNGTVKKFSSDKQGFCYQYNDIECNNKKHFHLICESCGKLIHFNSIKILEAQSEALEKENFNIDLNKTIFYGICKECERHN